MAKPSNDRVPDSATPYWERKTLHEMSCSEWESLCDGCGRCCLHKLEDEDTGRIHHTDVACRLLDLASCRCANYHERLKHVPDCAILNPENLAVLAWMPLTCAYRRLAEGRSLARWHPLVSGTRASVHRAGISICGIAVSESAIGEGEIEEHVIRWLKSPRGEMR